MKLDKKKLITHVANVVTIALIVECFLCAMMLVNKYGRANCFIRIEESATQMSKMFAHTMEQHQNHLTVFADMLETNDFSREDWQQSYVDSFYETQNFASICLHQADGLVVSRGAHPHNQARFPSFDLEAGLLPYISRVYGDGNTPAERYVYIAVPVEQNGQTIAALYGCLSLEVFPSFIASTAYGGNAQYYVVDGDSGDFLMNEYHSVLGNIYDETLDDHETKTGYDLDTMRSDIKAGRSGYLVFTSHQDYQRYYTYYMPLGINNWSMLMSIDEPTAFASYYDVNHMLVMLAIAVVVLMVIHVLVLMADEKRSSRRDQHNLHKSNYINAVQRALINAHSSPDFVDHALKIVAEEMHSETVLLLSLSQKTITNARYWPSVDKAQAMNMVGRNIREDFPTLYDALAAGESVIFDMDDPAFPLSSTAKAVFQELVANNAVMVPITDNAGIMKGILAAVNLPPEYRRSEMLECITYDFFMALSNLENHAIIQRMGAMDYLTNLKNRNSFETEVSTYATQSYRNLWCVFVDVNGLHEVNNTHGHKAGDRMLCAVADAVKRAFGENFSYRLGGDEFVAFAPDCTEEELLRRKTIITRELARRGYYVSMGYACTHQAAGHLEVDSIIAEAEAAMYQEKWEFYQAHNLPTQRGHFPNLKPKEE